MTEKGRTAQLREDLEAFGHPEDTASWADGDVNYVSQLRLTAADIPQLLAVARQWLWPLSRPKSKDDVSIFAPIHAWRGLAQLRAVEAVEVLLEMMEPLTADEDDWHVDEFPSVFAWIGPAAVGPLAEYLRDRRRRSECRTCAAEGLARIAACHPETRGEVVALLRDALAACEEEPYDLNTMLVTYLIDLKAVEAAEVIERAHAANRVDIDLNGPWDEVRRRLGVEGLGLVPKDLQPYSSMPPEFRKLRELMAQVPEEQREEVAEDLLRRLLDKSEAADDDFPWADEEYLGEDDEHDYADETPVEPLRAAMKVGRNDPCPCGSGKKYKKCCGR